ncbi:hypothetical protein D3OALGA1CA_940 [Olavius algarvensis associated proteobacterium Delta 3]|nr:hypothetical protein D3OALGA1CA_940 [Olavius algarvensis associated proteobacterium Delta 3]CAB5129569.1 hypothetical protein D3OALGB2SA_3527 [Olavius algarvensis associated proteobacterium Delta 3]
MNRLTTRTGVSSGRGLLSIGILCLLLGLPLRSIAADSRAAGALDNWLEQQSRIKTWTADVVQVRKLKSLARPLEARGKVWFAHPNRFRWVMGDPPRTIAVRTREQLLVIYPRFKRVEQYPIGDVSNPAWKQVLALLEVGFPSDADAFRERYELLSGTKDHEAWRFELQPIEKEAQRLLKQVRLEVSLEAYVLRATELVFPDGSIMRNQFSRHRLNPEVSPGTFDYDIGEDYKVVQPLRSK